MAVAAEEIDQPEHVGIAIVADDHRPAAAGLDQPDAPQDQRPHDPLAQFRLGDQQGAQPLGRDLDRLAAGQRLGVDQGRPPRQLRELAHERAGLVDDDRRLAAALDALADLDLAGEDQHQPVPRLAGPGQMLAGAEMAAASRTASSRATSAGVSAGNICAPRVSMSV